MPRLSWRRVVGLATALALTQRVRSRGYLQHDEERYLADWDALAAASYQSPLPDVLATACRGGAQAPAELDDCVLPAGEEVTTAEAQQVCGAASCRCIVPDGTTLHVDGNLKVTALVVRGVLLWEGGGTTAVPRWLCAGYLVAEDNGRVQIVADDDGLQNSAAIVYIMDNGATHDVVGKRVFGAVHTAASDHGMPIVEVVGRPLVRTWSLLASTVQPGATELNLMHDAEQMGWRVGDRLAVAPTARQSNGNAQTFVIESIDANTVRFVADSLPGAAGATDQQYRAEGRMRAEVGHLARSIVITGDDFVHEECGSGECTCRNHATRCTLGLHTLMHGKGILKMSHTRIEKCGQRGIPGRYCVHMHFVGECPDCLVHGNVVETSQQRGVIVHETHLSTVSENVMYNVRGANYYLEDGNEMHNTLAYNIAICPNALNGPLAGCTLPGTDNGESDTSLNQAGIWSLAHNNHFIGNRMVNSFNGLLFHSQFAPHGRGAVSGKVCTSHAPFGRLIGNTCHGHGRFGHYFLVSVFPRQVSQILSLNGMTASDSCKALDRHGLDRGFPTPLIDATDYDNTWMGSYSLGDLQFQGHVQPKSQNTMYWKESKNMADGCSAHILDSYFGDGFLSLPDVRGTLLIQNSVFRGSATLGANHHCGVGVTGMLCNPQYIFHNVTWAVTSPQAFVFEPAHNDGGIFALAPPDALMVNSGIFPPGYQALVGASKSYLLGIDGGAACKTAADVVEGTSESPRKYARGILCRRPVRRLNIWTRGMEDGCAPSSVQDGCRLRDGTQLTSTALRLTVQVYQDDALVSEGSVPWWQIGKDGQTLKQGYPLAVALGDDLRYSLALEDGSDIPSDWVVEFSDNIMGNRFGVETVRLDIQGRDCGTVVTSQHDRRYIEGNLGGNPAMFGRAAAPPPPPRSVSANSGAGVSTGLTVTFSCENDCAGLVFTASAAEGQDVCQAHGCGSGAPYVGISTFGCSGSVNSWGGDCCNVATCEDHPPPPPAPPGPSPPPGATDLAIGVPATSSSGNAAHAVDGRDATRWESSHNDPQWLEVDLGSEHTLCSAQIKWEAAYSRDFLFQTSATGGANADDWETILAVTGQSIADVNNQVSYTFLHGSRGRYVRFYGTSRATVWGHSFWRWSLYSVCSDGTSCSSTACPDTTAVASSESCASLGWSVPAQAAGTAAEGVCSGRPSTVSATQCGLPVVSYAEAVAMCQDDGARLCTRDELMTGLLRGQCGASGTAGVWWSSTTSACTGVDAGSYMLVTLSEPPEEFGCRPPGATRRVLCCADETTPQPLPPPPSPTPIESCGVACDGLVFTGGPREGQAVCASEGCGNAAPYVGLGTFGCSDDVNAWGGSCCDTRLCNGAGRRREQELAADVDMRARGACSGWDDMPPVDCDAVPKLAPSECPEFCDGGCWNGFCDCGHHRCVCKPGFSGEFCEVDVCASARCGEHGHCTARYLGGNLPVVTAACECDPPYSGPTCESNPCADVDCGDHGSCMPINEFESRCDCDAGWSGLDCAISCNSVCDGVYPHFCNAGIAPAFCFAGGGCGYSVNFFDSPNACCINGCDPCADVVCTAPETDCEVAGVCVEGACTASTLKTDGSICHSQPWGTCVGGVCTANPAPSPPESIWAPPPPPPPSSSSSDASTGPAQRRNPRPPPPPPPPIVVNIEVFALSDEEEVEAAQVVAEALVAAVQAAIPEPPPPEQRSCASLGWSVPAQAAGTAAEGVCSGRPSTVSATQCGLPVVSYAEAVAMCQDDGARLCTRDELMTGLLRGQCGASGTTGVWWSSTTSACTGQKAVLVTLSEQPEEFGCRPFSATRRVLCCGDAVARPPRPPRRRPPVAKVQSSVTFPVQLSQIVQGTPERIEFESGLKTALAAEIGGGTIFTASDVIIDGVTASGEGRRRLSNTKFRRQQSAAVDATWHVETPPEVMGVVANLVATVAETAADITVSVGGVQLAAAAVASPIVYEEPDVDCVGRWLECDTDCRQLFEITTVASGHGEYCETIHSASRACAIGEGGCADTKDEGAVPLESIRHATMELRIAIGAAATSLLLVFSVVAYKRGRRRSVCNVQSIRIGPEFPVDHDQRNESMKAKGIEGNAEVSAVSAKQMP